MPKEDIVYEVAKKLADRGMDYNLAKKNLLQCDIYFIDALIKLLG